MMVVVVGYLTIRKEQVGRLSGEADTGRSLGLVAIQPAESMSSHFGKRQLSQKK